MRRILAALGAMLVLLLSFVALSAHAAEDVVKSVDARFDIQADGSVKVRYELQWQFGEKGRRGIDFGIATRENWTADPTKDASYEVSDVAVDSPSGAPDSFTQRTIRYDSSSALSLRIGDPDRTVDGIDATYVITYTIKGTLRTFDSGPEFHWDVTSYNYPRIEAFKVTVKAPSGAVRAGCRVGSDECDVATEGSTTTLTGTGVAAGDVLTTAVGMDDGVVANAQPILVPVLISSPVLDNLSGSVTVGRDGVARVKQTLALRFPEGKPHTVDLFVPARLPWSEDDDQLFTVSEVTATDSTGAVVSAVDVTPDRHKKGRVQFTQLTLTGNSPGDSETFRIAYDVTGAAYIDGDRARFGWPMQLTEVTPTTVDLIWTFPGDVMAAGCAIRYSASYTAGCDREITRQGSGMAWRGNGWGANRRMAAKAELPAGALDGVRPRVELNPDKRLANDILGGGALGLGGFVVALLGSQALVRRPLRDRRHKGVAPGLTGGEGVALTSPNVPVPVQFNAPDVDYPLAGLLLDGKFDSRHTAAVLTQLAVDGLVVLTSKPLSVARASGAKEPKDVLRQGFFRLAKARPDKVLGIHAMRSMNQSIISEQNRDRRDRSLFVGPEETKGPRRKRQLLVAGLALLLIIGIVSFGAATQASTALITMPVLGLVIGAMIGLASVSGNQPQPLQPDGTAMRDQIRGFRTYIATAEANQLDFEADQDIYRRYLPWAVLFGLTERWTKVCQQLAAAGSIPPLDTSFWVGNFSASDVASGLGTFSDTFTSATNTLTRPVSSNSSRSNSPQWGSSSGSSGSSSGFSSSSSGGSGGGGTSASSW